MILPVRWTNTGRWPFFMLYNLWWLFLVQLPHRCCNFRKTFWFLLQFKLWGSPFLFLLNERSSSSFHHWFFMDAKLPGRFSTWHQLCQVSTFAVILMWFIEDYWFISTSLDHDVVITDIWSSMQFSLSLSLSHTDMAVTVVYDLLVWHNVVAWLYLNRIST